MAVSAGPAVARDLNLRAVLALLRTHGPLTQAELVRRSGLARPTVGAIVRDLQTATVVTEVGTDAQAAVGRPGALLGFNPHCATAAVVRVLPDGVDVWLLDADGTPLSAGRAPNTGVAGPTLTLVTRLLHGMAAAAAVPRPTSVALLLAGRVDPSTGLCTGPALDPSPVPVDELGRSCQATVTVLNPTAAAALGVARRGRYDDALVIFVDHGIGAGLVCGGAVLRGAVGGAGELGHCRVADSDRRCACGRVGCLETTAAGWYLRQRSAELLAAQAEVPATLAGLEALGHPEVDALLTEAADRLALAASWLVNTLNPTVVLLGGTPFVAGAHRFLSAFAAGLSAHGLASHTGDLVVDFAAATADVDGATEAALDRLVIPGVRTGPPPGEPAAGATLPVANH